MPAGGRGEGPEGAQGGGGGGIRCAPGQADSAYAAAPTTRLHGVRARGPDRPGPAGPPRAAAHAPLSPATGKQRAAARAAAPAAGCATAAARTPTVPVEASARSATGGGDGGDLARIRRGGVGGG